ncbi:hypothetical protein [Thiobaca trueperi]|uniref:hypothetical protein n=1 Tax=Thiobaca trueperi TaxID=127458 RepID=UPI0010452FDD|nr:hypothetical protein [Thiobaca trueperi]
MSNRYFFDVPVYRLPREKYYQQRQKYIEDVMFPKDSQDSEALKKLDEEDPSQNTMFRDHLQKSYGGCWRFNEIIGYIRLYFLGSQVRGEYYGVRQNRIVKTRKKTLEFQTWKLAAEMDVPYPPNKSEILGVVRNYLENCKKELPRRYIDTEIFEAAAPYIDWKKLYEKGLAQQ